MYDYSKHEICMTEMAFNTLIEKSVLKYCVASVWGWIPFYQYSYKHLKYEKENTLKNKANFLYKPVNNSILKMLNFF